MTELLKTFLYRLVLPLLLSAFGVLVGKGIIPSQSANDAAQVIAGLVVAIILWFLRDWTQVIRIDAAGDAPEGTRPAETNQILQETNPLLRWLSKLF